MHVLVDNRTFSFSGISLLIYGQIVLLREHYPRKNYVNKGALYKEEKTRLQQESEN